MLITVWLSCYVKQTLVGESQQHNPTVSNDKSRRSGLTLEFKLVMRVTDISPTAKSIPDAHGKEAGSSSSTLMHKLVIKQMGELMTIESYPELHQDCFALIGVTTGQPTTNYHNPAG